jgi:hypothetical protein
MGSGGQISHTHWIRIQEALEEAFTEKFRLQIMEWSKNWRKQSGEGHDWTMMQFLAKVDSEYTRLVHLNQWKTHDPNSTIVALRAEISKQKPTWVPKDGQPLEVLHNNKKWKYCGRCKRWNQTHTTLEHKSKADLPTQPAPGGSIGGPSANLAPGTQAASGNGSSADTSTQHTQPVPSGSSIASGSYLDMDF